MGLHGREGFLKPDFFFSGWLEASPGAWKFFREAGLQEGAPTERPVT